MSTRFQSIPFFRGRCFLIWDSREQRWANCPPGVDCDALVRRMNEIDHQRRYPAGKMARAA